MSTIKLWLGLLAFVLALGVIGRADFEDAQRAEQRRCTEPRSPCAAPVQAPADEDSNDAESVMEKDVFEARLQEVKARCYGRWTEILRALGVDERVLNRRNQACPMCGGTDRFQYTDKFGQGNYHCRGCGPGGGLKLLQGYHHWSFATTLRRVEACVGAGLAASAVAVERGSTVRMMRLARRLWDEARPITAGDDVDRYLRARGLHLAQYPATLRCHPALGYFEKDASGKTRKVAEYAAMLACVQASDGQMVTLHRTYIRNGEKALGRDSKKVLSSGIIGAAVRLDPPGERLALTEGIETGLAIHLGTGQPVWAALSAGSLEKVWIPDTVRRVSIYADNDATAEYRGQGAAFVLAARLRRGPDAGRREVEVFVPRAAGSDWADVWLRRLRRRTAAAG